MTTKILIARHGNTFDKGQTPTRVGANTDLPLVEQHRGRSIGNYLRNHELIPDAVYAAPLKRTMRTAELAIEGLNADLTPIAAENFKEIDYGPDENMTEDAVMLRLGNGDIDKGRAVIDAWNTQAIVPNGWEVNPEQIIENWQSFAHEVESRYFNGTVLLISSNGIMRFAPCLTGNFKRFAERFEIKVSTGGMCIFEKSKDDPHWRCTAWNLKPYELCTEQDR